MANTITQTKVQLKSNERKQKLKLPPDPEGRMINVPHRGNGDEGLSPSYGHRS